MAPFPGLLRRLQAHPPRLHRSRPRPPRRIRQAAGLLPEDDQKEPPHRHGRHP
ncbi:MAG: hypothetical protein MZV64_29005 [Ignavibacteriales bacterium]|nr:hypothetical protein [Ignavibacteriales bacterium]